MINTQGKLLISAFVAMLVGLVLIQPVADDIAGVSTESFTILNESVSLAIATSTNLNESNTLDLTNSTTLSQDFLTVLTEIRNTTAEVVTSQCNVTRSTGVLKCNETSVTNVIFVDYTYNSTVSGTLANDEIVSFDACRDSLMNAILAGIHCNVTLATGEVIGEYDNFTVPTAFIDYTYDTDNFVRSAAARSLLNLTILFFALAVLAVGIGYVIGAFKDSDLM